MLKNKVQLGFLLQRALPPSQTYFFTSRANEWNGATRLKLKLGPGFKANVFAPKTLYLFC